VLNLDFALFKDSKPRGCRNNPNPILACSEHPNKIIQTSFSRSDIGMAICTFYQRGTCKFGGEHRFYSSPVTLVTHTI
jgi:hypothetical protein